jgi:hypothetical protein
MGRSESISPLVPYSREQIAETTFADEEEVDSAIAAVEKVNLNINPLYRIFLQKKAVL